MEYPRTGLNPPLRGKKGGTCSPATFATHGHGTTCPSDAALSNAFRFNVTVFQTQSTSQPAMNDAVISVSCPCPGFRVVVDCNFPLFAMRKKQTETRDKTVFSRQRSNPQLQL